ncbi:hypothetical protein AB0M43_36810 [Longispora sp. NPDC051575]|uniref:hypothetical protein n=1 Tax=Longispora sp. NPDC051575 TaxID=3154943 RepID=UPI00343DA491
MNLDGVIEPPTTLGSARYFRVSYLPTYAALLLLLVIVWAGGRAWWTTDRISFKAAWKTASGLGAGEVVVLFVAVTLAALVLFHLQPPLVAVLSGGWPRWLGSGLALRLQRRRYRSWRRRTLLPQREAELTDAVVQRAGQAAARLRRRFPLAEHLLRPTALGNALAAATDGAGRAYGIDAAAVWPRIYPVLGDPVRNLVDDRRDALDSTARLAATLTVTGLGTALLLGWSGWWALLALAPLTGAAACYVAAVRAAEAYGELVHVAFDLHRFELLDALRVRMPDTAAAQHAAFRQLSDLWRQNVPATLEYTEGRVAS